MWDLELMGFGSGLEIQIVRPAKTGPGLTQKTIPATGAGSCTGKDLNTANSGVDGNAREHGVGNGQHGRWRNNENYNDDSKNSMYNDSKTNNQKTGSSRQVTLTNQIEGTTLWYRAPWLAI